MIQQYFATRGGYKCGACGREGLDYAGQPHLNSLGYVCEPIPPKDDTKLTTPIPGQISTISLNPDNSEIPPAIPVESDQTTQNQALITGGEVFDRKAFLSDADKDVPYGA